MQILNLEVTICDLKIRFEIAKCDLKEVLSIGYLNPICLPDEGGGSSVSFFNSSNTTLKYLS